MDRMVGRVDNDPFWCGMMWWDVIDEGRVVTEKMK